MTDDTDDTNDVRLFHRTVGEGRALVVLPGFGLDGAFMAAAFEPVFTDPALGGPAPGEGLRRIYVDLPGHGRSPAAGETSEDVLALVARELDRIAGPEPYLLAGHSYGGYLGCALARRTPERLAGLMLVTSGYRADPARRDLTGVEEPPAPEPGWLDDVPDAGLRDYLTRSAGRPTLAVGRRLAAAFAVCGPQDEPYLERLRERGFALADEDAPFRYHGPASVVAGRRDRSAGYRDSFRLLESLPAATFTVLPDAGHYLLLERPEAFARLVGEWVAQVRSGR